MTNQPTPRTIFAAAISVVFAVALPMTASAEQETPYSKINAAAAASPIEATPLRGNLTMLSGSGGNITVFAGKDGLFLVDTGITVSQAKIEKALNDIQPGPISYVVNTHWHWDHTDGNGWAHRDGATIIAQAHTARHLTETIEVVEWGHTFPPAPTGYEPTALIDKSRKILFNGENVTINRYVDSHTDGDLAVYFPKADVLATGDTYWNGIYPFIDYVEGGGIDGMIAAANENIDMADVDTLVVPGHGPVGSRATLIEYRDMLVAIRSRVAALKASGLSLEAAIAAKPTADYDAKWGGGVISPALMTELVYRGVSN
ncbi:MBL fold metallo-hydrolase [uncultured Hyphomonas sp.]|uniref:MBL fold metallo-hydrolase n=1 Tax=uncultured Hyphomonas sp. TaxID=225298 RepID=UPI002AAB0D70|nr:MBL fold metallo-hydrolase [uncultured Hyphomonas sp.]